MEKLSGDYIAGFVDGEGCFALKFIRAVRQERKNKPIYFYWTVEFAIVLRADDSGILERIKYTLGCGTINGGKSSKTGSVRYSIIKLDDLTNIIVPFFNKYPLQAKKRLDYFLWVEAVSILIRNKQIGLFKKINMSDEDILRLKEIHAEMDLIKSKRKTEWKWLIKG